MTLYISKINDIDVLQDINSDLSSTNKSSNRGDLHRGKNKNLDLGEGEKKISTSFIIRDNTTMQKLFKVLTKERKCTLTDKFLGILKVSILSYDIKNSDKHNGITKVNITFGINEDFNIDINFRGNILNDIHKLNKNMNVTYLETNKYKGETTNINIMDETIKDDYITKYDSFNRYSDNIVRNSEIKRTMSSRDIMLKKGLTSLSDMNLSFNSMYNYADVTNGFSAINLSDYGSKGVLAHNKNSNSLLFNKALLVINLTRVLNTNITNVENIINNIYVLSDNCIKCLDNCLIDDTRIDFYRIIENIIGFRDFHNKKIIEVSLNGEILSRYVFKRYGDLENLEHILYLNNLQDDTIVFSTIKVIA